MALTMHWGRDASVDQLLTIFERVNREVPIAQSALVDRASQRRVGRRACERMKALGVGWTVQDAMYFGGDQFVQQSGAGGRPARAAGRHGGARSASPSAPAPTRTAWLRTIRSPRCSGSSTARPSAAPRFAARRRRRAAPTRCACTRSAARGSRATSRQRGSLEVGKLADLAVLSRDYMTVPVDQIGGIESVLTMVGGKVVYAAARTTTMTATVQLKSVRRNTTFTELGESKEFSRLGRG